MCLEFDDVLILGINEKMVILGEGLGEMFEEGYLYYMDYDFY